MNCFRFAYAPLYWCFGTIYIFSDLVIFYFARTCIVVSVTIQCSRHDLIIRILFIVHLFCMNISLRIYEKMTHAFGWDAVTCCDYFEVIYHFHRNIYSKMAQEEVILNVYDMVSMSNDYFITLTQNNMYSNCAINMMES